MCRRHNTIAASCISLYSLAMKRTALLVLLTGILAIDMGAMFASTTLAGPWWIGFLILVPMVLGLLVWRRVLWAAMACVIYGTVGFALDLSTTVQILTKDSDIVLPVLSSSVSGALNFLLIVFGGRSFVEAFRAPQPQEFHPPSPPSLS